MSVTWTFSAVPTEVRRARELVAGFAERHGFDDNALERTRLAVSEAATNVVIHAYRDRSVPGELRVAAAFADGTLQVTISDDGVGSTPRRPDSPGSGSGLSILNLVCDTVEELAGAKGGTELFLTIRALGLRRLDGHGQHR